MSSQWPLLIPFVSMAAGLTLSAQNEIFCSPAGVAAGFACLLVSSCLRGRLIFSIAVPLFFFLFGLYALTPWLMPVPAADSIRSLASDKPVILEGIIMSRPSVSSDGSSVIVDTGKLIRNRRAEPVQGRLMLYLSRDDVSLARGDRIRFATRISVPRLLGLPGEFNFPRFLAFQRVSAIGRIVSQEDVVLMRSPAEESWQRSIDLVARRLGDAVRQAIPDEKVSSVLAALLIGDQKRIPRELADAYTRAGANHILSISGFHIGIIAAFITLMALWLLTRSEYLALRCNVRRLVVLLALPAMAVYLFITGAAPATARSVIMLAAFASALYAERESDPVNTLLFSAFFLVALNPPTLFDISFQLSFLSLWGIILFVPFVTSRISRLNSAAVRTIIQFTAASVAASCVTLIPVLFTFKAASLNGILTNFLIVPLLGYGAVLTGFMALPLLPLCGPSYSHILLWPSSGLVELSNRIIMACADLPAVRFHGITVWDMFFFLLFICIMTFVRNRKYRATLGVMAPVTALLVHIVPSGPVDGRLHITMLSVGQAESLLIRLPDGGTVLVDGGGYLHDTGRDFGQRILAPALGALGVGRIDRVISTHDHPDHIGGLAFIIRHFNVGEFLSSNAGLTSEYAADVRKILSDRRIPSSRLAAGDVITLSEGVLLTVYSPDKGDAAGSLSDEMNVNETSLVFRLTFNKFSMLFSADAGFTAEHQLLSGGYELASTVLKVGHHGSRYSTSEEFLDKVSPRLALISAGASNRFGLPAARTLNLLADRGIPVCRTDHDGTIELVSDGLSFTVATPYKRKG